MSESAIEGRQQLVGAKGKYSIDAADPIAYGRLSVLFAGEADSGQRVCVKMFRDRLETSEGAVDFARELTIISRLKHPAILPLIDYGTATEPTRRPFLVLPLCERGNLRSLLLTRNFLPLDEAMTYLRDVASALDYAHEAGIIHGDVKPENILLGDDDRARLADFGAAKYRLIGSKKNTTTARGITGPFTEMYASPEQIQAGRQSVRSDVYSFSMVAYELLTGESPVSDAEPAFQRMLAKIEGRLRDPIEVNPSLPKGVAEALMSGLHKEAKHRPRSSGELVLMLEAGFRIGGVKDVSLRNGNKQIFIVHGRDEAVKERTARFIEKIGADVVILHEMPSAGRTIIEKIEAYADVSAAVVLLTPDDVGALASDASNLKRRPRQNVIFELGYFAAKLGRERTIALYDPDVEVLSDFGGVVYIPLDPHGSWRMELVRELRAAGLNVSADSALA